MTTNRVVVFVCEAGKSLQEWVESWSQELQTKKKRKRTDRGQTASAGDGPEVREAAGQRTEEQEVERQATSRATKEERPEVKEVAEVEVPLARKRKRLMRAR